MTMYSLMEGKRWKLKLKSESCYSLSSAAATISQNHHQPYEDIQCVHVNPHAPVRLKHCEIQYPELVHNITVDHVVDSRVDGVVLLHTIKWLCLRPLNDLLGIIEEEHAEQDQASIDGHRVQTCSKRWGRWKEHWSWKRQKHLRWHRKAQSLE